jgi:DNA-nicking Smr family endonuclease
VAWWNFWKRTPADAAKPVDATPDDDDDNDDGDDEPDADVALTDQLDLHTFLPRECADVVEEYVRAAQEAGMTSVRIIHGKGKGTLRRIVHGVLEKHPAVASFRLGDERRGQWGATLVELRPRS